MDKKTSWICTHRWRHLLFSSILIPGLFDYIRRKDVYLYNNTCAYVAMDGKLRIGRFELDRLRLSDDLTI